MVKVIEHCRVSPPPGTVTEQSIPITFFDLAWLQLPPVQTLFFYQFPHPKSHFMDTVIPNLKHSLSLALKHFFPLASNMFINIPSSISSKPEIRYTEGDSVSLTFAESSNDFNSLIGNHEKNADQFYPLVPQMPANKLCTNVSESIHSTLLVPLFALQVTLFPNSGVCFGYTLNHITADGVAFISFFKSWASIAKFGGSDAKLLETIGSLSLCDRSVVRDPNGIGTIFWRQIVEDSKHEELCPTDQHHPPINKFRATFVMAKTNIQRLKELVLVHHRRLNSATTLAPPFHISAFTVTCAYIWICKVKSRTGTATTRAVDKDDDDEYFSVLVDCRERLDPPIPKTYFGNCLMGCYARAKHSQLIGEEGFVIAAESIGKAVGERLHGSGGVLKGMESWLSDYKRMDQDKMVGLAGSTKISIYEPDFGWGRPQKIEVVSIDLTGAISINECMDSQGDLEIGVSFPKNTMDAFASIFIPGLNTLGVRAML
ncbi:phenolic glucoside malonyltransferase 1-like [Cornus florida]|uniref:phenolic glucoside malonyltransferase 1-like n=1 Tax=Cornus florida TaxID=4283 RepID=UPI0028A181D8|nr:phenolic glucoside malonyltransferase 1-like [Cornus florida]